MMTNDQDDVAPGSPKFTLRRISVDYEKKKEKEEDKIRSYTDKTSRQMEFIITKKDGQKKKE